MVPWTFELDSADGLADFIEYHSCLLSEADQVLGKTSFTSSEIASKGKEALHTQALAVGRATWGMRQALIQWVREDGRAQEREAILQAARPTTTVLLARLWKMQPDAPLEEVMASEQAVFALHDEERAEIAYLRPELWLTLWKQKSHVMQSSSHAYEREVAFFESRLMEERKRLEGEGSLQAKKQRERLNQLEEQYLEMK
jgi:hypothetical protein